MSVETLQINGIDMDVYYTCNIEKDPYGTGDSPKEYQVDIISIEIGVDTQNVYEILPSFILDQIIEDIIEIERE